jgi:hypothetical protein
MVIPEAWLWSGSSLTAAAVFSWEESLMGQSQWAAYHLAVFLNSQTPIVGLAGGSTYRTNQDGRGRLRDLSSDNRTWWTMQNHKRDVACWYLDLEPIENSNPRSDFSLNTHGKSMVPVL